MIRPKDLKVGIRLGLLSGLGILLALVVGLVGIRGTSTMDAKLNVVDRANAGQKAVAEVDASHDNVYTDVLLVLQTTDSADRSDALATLKDDAGVLTTKTQEAADANVSSAISSEAQALQAPVA